MLKQVLRQSSSIIVSLALAVVAIPSAYPNALSNQAQSTATPQLSTAVTQNVLTTVVSTYNRAKAGTVTAADLQSEATALRILFAYMQEKGLNAKLQSTMLASSSAVDNGFSAAQVSSIYASLSSAGGAVTVQQLSSLLGNLKGHGDEIVSDVKTKGVAGIEQAMVQELLVLAAIAQQDGGSMASLRGRGKVRLLNASLTASQCANLASLEHEAEALSLAAAALGAEPVAAGFAAAAAGYAIEEEVGGC